VSQVERRDWVENADELRRLKEFRAQLLKDGLPSSDGEQADTYEYANLLARQAVRRELMALRRRVEEWASSPLLEYTEPGELLVDMATALDERISDVGGEDRR
jgi:hypothetical protein